MLTERRNPAVIIIGAGMTGILLAIKLREAGIENIILLEAKDRVGGTWRENNYPGVACDVPSFAYTYEFEPNPDWSNLFAKGPDIQSYFESVHHKYGLADVTHFNERAISSTYSDGKWTVRTSTDQVYIADLLFSATGILHEPTKPDFPGMQSFKGAVFHTAEWDHSVELRGKRIGCIGTGSTAAQAIPELVNIPETEVTVFQRTAQWLMRAKDTEFDEEHKNWLRKHPRLARLQRNITLRILAVATASIAGDSLTDKLVHRLMSWQSRRYLEKSVRDPVLRKKLTPDYKFGCKRIVVNASYYDAIQRPNAQLETSGIDHFVEDGIVTREGVHHPLDVVVLSTGFNPLAFMRPMQFRGRDGLDINDAWSNKVQAYRSVCIPGFPNYFLMLGPNTPIANFSVIAMSEVQCRYILQLINHWRTGLLDTVEATEQAMLAWNTRLKASMGKTAWASGCQSWYLDTDGDPMTWPDSWNDWVKAMEVPELGDFVLPGQPGSA